MSRKGISSALVDEKANPSVGRFDAGLAVVRAM